MIIMMKMMPLSKQKFPRGNDKNLSFLIECLMMMMKMMLLSIQKFPRGKDKNQSFLIEGFANDNEDDAFSQYRSYQEEMIFQQHGFAVHFCKKRMCYSIKKFFFHAFGTVAFLGITFLLCQLFSFPGLKIYFRYGKFISIEN